MPETTTITPLPPKPRLNVALFILLAVVFTATLTALVTAGGSVLYFQSLQTSNQTQTTTDQTAPTPTGATTPAAPTTPQDVLSPEAVPSFPDLAKAPAGWNLYTSSKYNYAFAYPPKYAVLPGRDEAGSAVTQSTDKSVTVTVDQTSSCSAFIFKVTAQAPVDMGTLVNETKTNLGALEATKRDYTAGTFAYSVITANLADGSVATVRINNTCSAAEQAQFGIADQQQLVTQMLTTFQFK